MGKSDYLRLRTLNKFGRAAARMIKAPPIKVVGVRISEKNINPKRIPKRISVMPMRLPMLPSRYLKPSMAVKLAVNKLIA